MHKIWLLLFMSTTSFSSPGTVLRVFLQQRLTCSSSRWPSIAVFSESMHAKKIDQETFASLHQQEMKGTEILKQREQALWQRVTRYRIAADAIVLRKSFKDIFLVLQHQDHELLSHVLACGADPNATEHISWGMHCSAVGCAIKNGDTISLKMLLGAGAKELKRLEHVAELSSQALKLLIEHGAYPVNWQGYSTMREFLSRIDLSTALTHDDRAEILKKVMLLVHAGAWPDGVLDKSLTHEQFPDLFGYLRAKQVLQAAEASSPEKDDAQEVVYSIMNKYGITPEEIMIANRPKVSTRVQEAE